jgi:tetratricopeptide (TPR) repeat protein
MILCVRGMHPTMRTALVGLLVAALIGPTLAQAADCRTELAEAEQYYEKGRFDEAIALLEGCLSKSDLPQEERSKVYRLIGLTYLAQDYRDKAKLAVVDLLRLVPDYECDPRTDPPTFCSMLDEERARMAPDSNSLILKQGHSKWTKWLLIAGGAIVTGGIIALVASGGDEPSGGDGAIAGPPALPDGH